MRGPLALSIAAVLVLSSVARADDTPSADLRGSFSPLHHEAGLGVEPVTVPETGDVTASLRLTYAFRPVVLRDETGEIAARVIEHQFTGDAAVSFGLFGRLALGVDLPHVLGQTGDSLEGDPLAQAAVGTRRLPITAMGDPGLRAKVAIVIPDLDEHGVEQGFGLGADERFTLPLGDEGSFLGEGTVTSETRVLVDGGLGALTIHGYAGVKLRGDTGSYACPPDQPQGTCNTRFGHELPLGLGFAFHPSELGVDDENRVTLFAETHARMPLSPVGPFDSTLAGSWYASVAGRFRFGDLALLGAVELGLTDGVGVAPFRATLGVSFAPRQRDADADGFGDDDDRCPTFAEDRDGFEDGDGCPEMDNDADGVPDALDTCPTVAGGKDGAQPGCPG
jgi:hypothetical protein